MAVKAKDIMFLGAANRATADTGTQGGAIDKSVKVTFKRMTTSGGTLSIVTEGTAAADESQVYTIYYRDTSGALLSTTVTTHSTDPNTTLVATSESDIARIEKVTTSATPTGNVAIMDTSAITTAATFGATTAVDECILNASASSVDDYYLGWVLRVTSGTAQYDIREVVKYVGSTKTAYFRDLSAVPTAGTDEYTLAPGVVFETAANGSGTQISEVTRLFYDAASSESASKDLYDKFFVYNCNSTTTLSNATVEEVSGGHSSVMTLALETDNSFANHTGSITARTGYVPSGITSFGNGPIDVANSKNLTNGSGQGVWGKLSLSAGASPANDDWTIKVNGQTT